ncbi:hypothetical protein CDD83_4164 [Cordyceps sp. RAO-2017]|nr:hypothetical protein CDD83_4164 [Cordyceps sp. RAO-2017]
MSDPNNYSLGWISAIDLEYAAAQVFLDNRHAGPRWAHRTDNNHYTLGTIGNHNVVMAALPSGEAGTHAATAVAKDMMATFTNVKACLMVGIGGGAPSERHDIRLGDVVVSTPSFHHSSGNHGGVFQYDYGRTVQERRFQSARYLNQPPRSLLTAVTGLRARHRTTGNDIDASIRHVIQANRRMQREYSRPNPATDKLYATDKAQDTPKLVERAERTEDDDNPAIHYGLIASADNFMEDAEIRDILSDELDVLCFEMEAAGLMNNFPCIVIRGICDYADSHWCKEWRGYAAMAAAAYARELLLEVRPQQLEAEKGIGQLLDQRQ